MCTRDEGRELLISFVNPVDQSALGTVASDNSPYKIIIGFVRVTFIFDKLVTK